MRADHLSFVAGHQPLIRFLLSEHIEVVEPEIGEHLLQLPVAGRGAHELLLNKLADDLRGTPEDSRRILVVRALLRDAPIVVMDEPTSSLDSLTERSVVAGLKALLSGRTAIVIAHRFTTIQNADLVAVMDEGRLVEFGTPQKLLLDKGLYSSLSLIQGVPT